VFQEGVYIVQDAFRFLSPLRQSYRKNRLGLTRTCRQTYAEAKYIPLALGTLSFSNTFDVEVQLRSMGSQQRGYISSLTIQLKEGQHWGQWESWSRQFYGRFPPWWRAENLTFTMLPGLKQITVRMRFLNELGSYLGVLNLGEQETKARASVEELFGDTVEFLGELNPGVKVTCELL